jgi:hypothetical protein
MVKLVKLVKTLIKSCYQFYLFHQFNQFYQLMGGRKLLELEREFRADQLDLFGLEHDPGEQLAVNLR